MKRNIVPFFILMVIGALVIVASIELHARDLDHPTPPQQESVVVLELFTSQGCSSCPPADELLKRVQKDSEIPVVALSYHVDYWNYIGWTDPFSDPSFTERQSSYNRKFGSRSNYTPQLVVNGREHLVGSNASKLYSKISSYGSTEQENTVLVDDVRKESGRVIIDYQVEGPIDAKRVRVALVIDQRDTYVKRGENRNRKLSNSNIVVAVTEKSLDSKAGSAELLIPESVDNKDKLKVVVLVENKVMDITGASKTAVF